MPASSLKARNAQELSSPAKQSVVGKAESPKPFERSMMELSGIQQVLGNRTLQRVLQSQIQRACAGCEKPVLDSSRQTTRTASLPGRLRDGVEALSGIAMDSVKVHYNSPEPARVQALAYTQGAEIHVAPGQEKHLAHEAWHVVQQQQGRVRPTMQLAGTAINDDSSLEREADSMGAKADLIGQQEAIAKPEVRLLTAKLSPCQRVVQRNGDDDMDIDNDEGWGMDVDDDRESMSEEPELDYYGGDESDYEELRAEADESDHPEGNPDKEELIDWSDLTDEGLRELDAAEDDYGNNVLFNVFLNLVAYYYPRERIEPTAELYQIFRHWQSGGVYTRGRFRNLIGLGGSRDDQDQDIIQRKRSGNTYSLNGPYKGTSKSFQYKNVIYLRDKDGNIDFTKNPNNILTGYNSATRSRLTKSSIKWTDPQDRKSNVKLQGKVKNSKKGVMPSGKSIVIPKASRAQHFAIADMLYKNKRSGKWTWHHLTRKYEMVLVDMRVHSKHGHNGGVFLW